MILVDSITTYQTKLRYKNWCHMVSDVGAEELHEFAAKLGLKREWSQERPKASAHHYDLIPTKRALAVKLGAIEVPSRELVTRNYDGLARRLVCGMYNCTHRKTTVNHLACTCCMREIAEDSDAFK